jgi:hypothetical protein
VSEAGETSASAHALHKKQAMSSRVNFFMISAFPVAVMVRGAGVDFLASAILFETWRE